MHFQTCRADDSGDSAAAPDAVAASESGGKEVCAYIRNIRVKALNLFNAFSTNAARRKSVSNAFSRIYSVYSDWIGFKDLVR